MNGVKKWNPSSKKWFIVHLMLKSRNSIGEIRMKKKISVIFGTRPEAIKLCPVVLELQKRNNVDCNVCVTGQHRHMLDQVLEAFQILPDVDLNLMSDNQTLSGFTAKAITALDNYLAGKKPDVVIAQGDTTTVFCSALSSFYHKIPFGHVEAGLRTGNMLSPWPEEGNRVLVSRLAKWHFAPTEYSRENLLHEGITENVFVTGNTVIDALLLMREKVLKSPPKIKGLDNGNLNFLGDRKMVLITGHRRENFGSGFENICEAIVRLSNLFPEVCFIYPVHLNPNVQEPVKRILNNTKNANLILLEPQAYPAFVALMERSTLILTDSGGVQEEAPSLKKPVLVMRDTTERPEMMLIGGSRLVGTDQDLIVNEVSSLLMNENQCQEMIVGENIFGDGSAAKHIVDILLGQQEDIQI
jgi:UDP-N-acetylglucosamine 2-epimerase (non-hydrolysing)